LTRPVGTAEERVAMSLVTHRTRGPSEEADVEGVALIIAEGILGAEFANLTVQEVIDAVYLKDIAMGRFLDDLLMGAANHRRIGDDSESGTYSAIARRAKAEFAAFGRRLAATSHRRFGFVDDVSRLISLLSASQAIQFLGEWYRGIRGRVGKTDRSGVELLNLTWLPVLVNILVIAKFVSVIAEHPGRSAWPAVIGWTVSLTYSLIAARYCVFVFSDLRLNAMPGAVRFAVPLCCVLIWPAILAPILIDWELWPICVAVGTAIIAANNEICARSYTLMQETIRSSHIEVSRLMSKAFEYLTDWRELMVIFSGSMFALTILIWSGVLHDVSFYGVVVAVAPAGKMYMQQTGKEAPLVHAGLHRMISAYTHARGVHRSGRAAESVDP
jgi:hypothetical protein